MSIHRNKAKFIPYFLYTIATIFFTACHFDPYAIKIDVDTAKLSECLEKNDRCLMVLSVATKNIPESSYKSYTDSLKHFNYNFQIIGKALGWNGWLTRGAAMRAAMVNLTKKYPQEKLDKIIIVSSDTGDVLVQSGPEKLLYKFNSKKIDLQKSYPNKFKKDLVMVGGEWSCGGNCEPRSRSWFDRLDIAPEKRLFPYTQGGFLMGSVPALLRYYNYTVEYMNTIRNDDQIAMGNFAINNPEYIYIDYRQELAATMTRYKSGNKTPKTGIDYNKNNLYKLDNKGYTLSSEVQEKIGSKEKIYPAFIHVPNNTRSDSVREFWEKLIEDLKTTAWK